MQTQVTVELRTRSGRKITEDKVACMEQIGLEIIFSGAFKFSDDSVTVFRAKKTFSSVFNAEQFYFEVHRCGGISKRMLKALDFIYEDACI